MRSVARERERLRSQFALRVLQDTLDSVRKGTPSLVDGCTADRRPHLELPNTETESGTENAKTKNEVEQQTGDRQRSAKCSAEKLKKLKKRLADAGQRRPQRPTAYIHNKAMPGQPCGQASASRKCLRVGVKVQLG
ncbi:uncharacterized protein UTRI_02357 [Ustilago trichophora]|uniref:Uncharacterized protein n=1 Tax=Ustilago trichophora TaxID=86804 RepID=A0A5C3E5V9_9BASI|nr:uncharacterized protein UTRI_02357 [Ustilago trichophora]